MRAVGDHGATTGLRAIGAFSRRGRGAFGDQFEALRTVTDGAERVRALDKILGEVPGPGPERNQILEGALEAISDLPPLQGKPLLARVVSMLPGVKPEWELWARALMTASTIADDTARSLAQGVANLDDADAWMVDRILGKAVRTLKTRAELLRWLLATQAKPRAGPWLGFAAGYIAVGNYTAAKPLLDAAHTRLTHSLTETQRRDLSRAMAQAYSFAPVDIGLPGIKRLFDQYSTVNDSFGTNSHFSLSAIGFNSVIALAIAGE